MIVHRLQWWPTIEAALGGGVVFAGIAKVGKFCVNGNIPMKK